MSEAIDKIKETDDMVLLIEKHKREIEELQNSLSILRKKVQEAEGETSIIKGIGMNSPEMKQANATIVELRQRVSELMSINQAHQDLMGNQIVENNELKRDNKALSKQIDDYFNARLENVRKFGV
jgi:lipase chaperone LimK